MYRGRIQKPVVENVTIFYPGCFKTNVKEKIQYKIISCSAGDLIQYCFNDQTSDKNQEWKSFPKGLSLAGPCTRSLPDKDKG